MIIQELKKQLNTIQREFYEYYEVDDAKAAKCIIKNMPFLSGDFIESLKKEYGDIIPIQEVNNWNTEELFSNFIGDVDDSLGDTNNHKERLEFASLILDNFRPYFDEFFFSFRRAEITAKYILGDEEGAYKLLNEWRKEYPGIVETEMTEIWMLVDAGDMEKALPVAKRMMKLVKSNPEVYVDLAGICSIVFESNGLAKEAEECEEIEEDYFQNYDEIKDEDESFEEIEEFLLELVDNDDPKGVKELYEKMKEMDDESHDSKKAIVSIMLMEIGNKEGSDEEREKRLLERLQDYIDGVPLREIINNNMVFEFDTLAEALVTLEEELIPIYAKKLNIYTKKLSEEEVAERIEEKLLDREYAKEKFQIMHEIVDELFLKLIEDNQDYSDEEAYILLEYFEAYALELPNGKFGLSKDVKRMYEEIHTTEYMAMQRKLAWIRDCMFALYTNYAVLEEERFIDMLNLHPMYRFTLDSAKDLYYEYFDYLSFLDWKDGYLFDKGLRKKKQYKTFGEKIEENYPYYPMTFEEINELSLLDYPKNDINYKKFIEYLLNNGCDYFEVIESMKSIYRLISSERSIQEVLNEIQPLVETFAEGIEDMQEVFDHLMQIWNNSRMYKMRGNIPSLLAKTMPKASNPTIVPLSTEAKKLLEEGENELAQMGINVDLKGDSQMYFSHHKQDSGEELYKGISVYPNDPCPCGSGKLYKDCHGLKKI